MLLPRKTGGASSPWWGKGGVAVIITGVRLERGGKRVTVITDGGDRYSVSEALYQKIGSPCVGDELDGYADEIASEDAEYRCMKRALSILAYADNNRLTLKRKLRQAGFSSSVVENCVEECLRLGYVDECRQLRRLIWDEAEIKLRGRKYITAKLSAKGYPAGLISKITDELVEEGQIDFDRSLARLVEKQGDGTDEMKKRLAYKYGYK